MNADTAMRQAAHTVEYYWKRMEDYLKEKDVDAQPAVIAKLVECCVREYVANSYAIDE